MKKQRNEELTSLRQTKVQIVKQFGGTSKLEEEIKVQLIFYLFEVESSFSKAMAFYIPLLRHLAWPAARCGGTYF